MIARASRRLREGYPPTLDEPTSDQQLAAVEGNQLATATAGAAAPVATAATAANKPVASAPVSTPVAHSSAAAPSAALPSTRTGIGSSGDGEMWLMAALLLGGAGVATTSIAYYRARVRKL